MTKKTTYLLGILITILVGTYFYISCCSSCGAGNEEVLIEETIVVPEAPPEPTSYPFSFQDGDYSYNVNDNFNFNLSSSSILLPLSQKVNDGVEGLKIHLSENVGKAINITGYYTSDEANKSAFPNLGLARANTVKNFLVDKGLHSSAINIFGELKSDMISTPENVFLGPVSYTLAGETEGLEDELKALYAKIKADPLVLYFETGEASINLTEAQRQQIADISRYLDKVEISSCSATGHTDNQGSRATNIKLGQERAEFAKSYLINNGISENKIKTSSKGPDTPIASNTTDEGRSQNRRTVVTLN